MKMFDMGRTGWRDVGAILVLFFSLLALGGAATAAKPGNLIIDFNSPAKNANITGSFDITADTNGTSNVSYVVFYHNRSSPSDWSEMANVSYSTEEQTSFTISNDTADFDDGPITFNATAWNGTHVDSSNISVTLDDTAPNATDNLSISEASNFKSSPVAENIHSSKSLTLNWSSSGSNELKDATSGVKEYDIEYRKRVYYPSNRSFGSWNDWSVRSTVDDSNSGTSVSSLDDGYQYRFRMVVRDWAGHTNTSNTVNATIDTSAPGFDTQDGGRVSTPFDYTNQESQNVTVNITDLSGIKDKVGERTASDTINLTVYNSSGLFSAPPIDITPDGGTPVEMLVETTEAVENLSHSEDYTVSVTATDMFSHRTTGLNWTFTADLQQPDSVS
ncbi:MAG: hypothetical protein ABEJ62_00400, partial [Candidatus Nanohaloarchaea archaeon]